MELGLSPGDFVLDGDPVALSPKGGGPPKFSVHVYCDQMAAWMKLVLGMVVGLSPGEFVLDGDPAPLSQKERGGVLLKRTPPFQNPGFAPCTFPETQTVK